MASQPVHGTLDTVSMQHLCRAPALKIREPKKRPKLGIALVYEALKEKRLLIYLDTQGSLRDEWAKTCGHEVIAQIAIAWSDLGGIVSCNAVGAIRPLKLNKTLQNHNFIDAGDRLVVRIGLTAVNQHSAPEFRIATNDSDFWDPRDSKKKGNASAPIASALAQHRIHSTILEEFFGLVARASAA